MGMQFLALLLKKMELFPCYSLFLSQSIANKSAVSFLSSCLLHKREFFLLPVFCCFIPVFCMYSYKCCSFLSTAYKRVFSFLSTACRSAFPSCLLHIRGIFPSCLLHIGVLFPSCLLIYKLRFPAYRSTFPSYLV